MIKDMKLLRGFLFIVLAFANNQLFSQYYLVQDNGNYRYFIGNQEPDINWKKINFDDSNWTQGYKNIGYGHKNDSTIIPVTPVPSIYLRIKFDLTDSALKAVQDANLKVDFDDAFVAYLNGTEIARVNLGKRGEPVPYKKLSERPHEALGYRDHDNLQLNGYYIDKDTLAKILKSGTNILAIQVQNDSIDGSDLSFNCNLVNLVNVYYSIWNYDCHYYRQVNFDTSYFPIVEVNTDAFGLPYPHVKYVAKMGIINNKNGKVNHVTDSLNEYNGRINIEWRGSSSVDFPKRSFNIETEDDTGANLDVQLLGMPAENDWILSGPFADKSQIRNELEFIIGRKLGHYEPRTRFCELLINGDLMGLYELAEKIKRNINRVNIEKLDNTSTDISGGYIVKYDKLNDGPDPNLQYVYPKTDEITYNQEEYINNFFSDFYSVLDKPEFLDPVLGYKKYIDPQSMIDYVIANEVSRNSDAYLYSTYLYKDNDARDGRIKYGPLWDYDIAFGTSEWQSGNLTAGWQFQVPTNERLMIHKVVKDTSFSRQLAQRWFQVRKGFLSNESIMNTIDSLTNYIFDARVRNYLVWPVINKHIFGDDLFVESSYDQDISRMKTWLTKRIAWIDGNISKLITDVPDITSGNNNNFSIYPNPFSGQFTVDMNIANSGAFNIELIDIFGKSIPISKNLKLQQGNFRLTINNQELSKISSGLYILTIRQNGMLVHHEKVVKY